MAEPKPERPPLNILEKFAFKVSPESMAAFRLGGLSRLVSHMVDRKAEFLAGKWPEGTEHHQRMQEIADEAVALRKLFSKKADVIVSPETKRYGINAASAEADSENHPGRSEDKKIINHVARIYAVFDGVSTSSTPNGGQLAAEMAADLTNRELSAIQDDLSLDDTQAAMAEAFLRINAEIIDTLNGGKEHHFNAMTTASVVKIWKDSNGERKAIIANMGDSRVYIKRVGGNLELITLDDAQAKMGRSPEEFRRLLKKFAAFNRQSELTPKEKGLYRDVNVITKSLGYSKSEVPEFTVVDLNPGDKLVITSDGVHDPVTDNDMEQRINSTTDMDKACQDILSDAVRNCANYRAADDRRDADMPRGKHADDKTIVIVEIGDVLAEGIAPNPAAPESATGSPTTPAPSGATEHTTRLPAPTPDAEPADIVEQLTTEYLRKINNSESINPPKSDKEKTAVRQIVDDARSGVLSPDYKNKFIRKYRSEIPASWANGSLDNSNRLWREAGAGEWIDEAMEATPTDPVTVAKNEYKSHLLGGGKPSLPETDVEKAAFTQLVAENNPIVKAVFISYYRSESTAVLSRSGFDGLDAFNLLWHGAGASDWMFEAKAAAGPTPAAAVETETSTTEPAEIAKALKDWRDEFSRPGMLVVMRVDSDAKVEGLRQLFAEVTEAGMQDKLRVWLREMVKRSAEFTVGGKSFFAGKLAKQYSTVDPVIAGWMKDYDKATESDKLDMQKRTWSVAGGGTIDRASIAGFQSDKYMEGESRAVRAAAENALQFTNVENLLHDPEIAKKLLIIISEFTHSKRPTAAELIKNPTVLELAKKLFLREEVLATIILQQFDVLQAQAVVEEKFTRSKKWAVGKSIGYLAATGAVIGMGMAAAPALATGAAMLSVGITGFKILDIAISTKKHRDSQAAIAKRNTEALTQSLTESAAGDYGTMTPSAKSALENLASAISIAKRTELNQADLTKRELAEQISDTLIETNLLGNKAILAQWEADYEALAADPAASPTDVHDAFVNYQKFQHEFDVAAEPFRRLALAQATLVEIDRHQTKEEIEITKSSLPDSNFRKAVNTITGLGGESYSERFGSMAVFMSLGILAREHPTVSRALAAWSGARLGMAAAEYGLSKLEGSLDTSYLTLEDVLDLERDTTTATIDELYGRAATTRTKLANKTFKKEQPFQYLKLKDLLDRFDQRTLYFKASYAILETNQSEADQLKVGGRGRHAKKILILSGALVGGMGGFLVGDLIVKHAAEKLAEKQAAEAQNTQPGSTAEQPGAAAPASPDQTNPAASPDAAAPAPTPGSTPDAANPAPAGAAPAAEIPPIVAGAPATPAASLDVSHFTKPEWTHATVHHHEGVSHALKEQLPASEYVQVMKDTKITVDGEQVAIFDPAHHSQLGVRQEEALTIVADKTGGHTTLHFYDAKTHQEIPNDSSGALGKYFYKMGDTSTGSVHGTHSAQVEVHTGTHTAEVPAAQHPTADSHQGFIDQWLHDRGFDQTSDVTAANLAGTPDYASTHDLEVATRQANAAYEASQAHAVSSGDHDEIAQSVGKSHGQHHGTGTKHESDGGGVVKAGKPTLNPDAGKAAVLPPAAEVTPANLAQTGLDHYKPTDYSRYQADVKHVLDTAGKDKVVGENGLIFTQKAGQILVDVPHSQGAPQVLDSAMYNAIQKEYTELVQRSPAYHGKFDSAVWITVVKNAEAARSGSALAKS